MCGTTCLHVWNHVPACVEPRACHVWNHVPACVEPRACMCGTTCLSCVEPRACHGWNHVPVSNSLLNHFLLFLGWRGRGFFHCHQVIVAYCPVRQKANFLQLCQCSLEHPPKLKHRRA